MKSIDYIGSLASIICLPITLLTVNWKNFSSQDNYWKIGLAFLLLILLIIFLINAYRKKRNENEAHQEMTELPQKFSEKEGIFAASEYAYCHMQMHIVCSKISEIFRLLKDVEIAVCLKIITQPDSIKILKTIARDSKSLLEREEFDNIPTDKFEENSDFSDLFSQHTESGKKWKDVFYIANNLPHLYDYKNSHMNHHKLDDGVKGFFTRHFQWKLPYKSTLIVAVSNTDKDELYAFLCIDSKRSFCFFEKDIEQLKKIAHLISNLVEITIAKSEEKIVIG